MGSHIAHHFVSYALPHVVLLESIYNNWEEIVNHVLLCLEWIISFTFGLFKISKLLVMGQSKRLTIEKKFWTWRAPFKFYFIFFIFLILKIWQNLSTETSQISQICTRNFFVKKRQNFKSINKKHQKFKTLPTNEYGLQMGISLFPHTSHILGVLLCATIGGSFGTRFVSLSLSDSLWVLAF